MTQEVSQTQSDQSSQVAAVETPSAPSAEGTQENNHPIASKNPVTKRTPEKSTRDFAATELARLEAQKTSPERKNPEVSTPIGGETDQNNPEIAAFQPNFKLKVLDKELEIPEHFRGLMKDEKSQAEVRELFEKAHGLEPVKQQRDQFKNQVKEFQTQALPELMAYRKDISEAREAYQKGDMQGFFKKLRVSDEKVLQYALDVIQYQEMSHEQKMLVDRERDARERAKNLEMQNQSLSSQYMTQVQQAKALGLDTALARADIKPIADAYNSRPGRNPEDPDFKEVVREYGDWVWRSTEGKTDLTPEQAAEAVIRRLGISAPQAAAAQSSQPQMTQQPAPKAQTQPQVPVIPNVSGRSTSPTKMKPKSLDDLKKLRDQMRD